MSRTPSRLISVKGTRIAAVHFIPFLKFDYIIQANFAGRHSDKSQIIFSASQGGRYLDHNMRDFIM